MVRGGGLDSSSAAVVGECWRHLLHGALHQHAADHAKALPVCVAIAAATALRARMDPKWVVGCSVAF